MATAMMHESAVCSHGLRLRIFVGILLSDGGASGTVDAGAAEDGAEALFKNCATCHEIGAGAKHKVGPHLDGLFGRQAGSLSDFKYSDGMRKAADEDGLVWDAAETLADQFLEKPRDFVKGNRMSFRGMA
jgi:cytochrome c